MCWFKGYAALVVSGVILSPSAWADKGDFVLGAGVSLDDADGKALFVSADYSIADPAWITASVGRSFVDLPRFQEIDTWYADLGIDTYWDPAGIRFSLAYWGDNEILDSIDLRTSVYSRNARGTLAIDAEFRDFELQLPPVDLLVRTKVPFNSKGLGLSGNVDLSERVNLSFSGMQYEYNVNLRSEDATRFLNLLSISRLSLLSSLIDWDISAGIGVDFGLRHVGLNVSKWRGAIDGGSNQSVTLTLLTPMTDRTDIEFGLGFDDSELYGEVLIFNVFIYFYGGAWSP